MRPCLHTLCALLLLCISSAAAHADQYIITLDPAARSEPATGRVILFFITERGGRWERIPPMEGPFFQKPQPIASIAVTDLQPGGTVIIDGNTPAFPQPLNHLNGRVRVQAVLDADQTERSHADGPGNVYSDPQTVTLSNSNDDVVRLTLTNRVEPKQPEDKPHLKWVRLRSEMLSAFYGRDVYHRAGVALPKQYHDANWPRQQWPAVYVIPGFGGREEAAEEYADMLQAPIEAIEAPNAVFIVLDPEAPLGHHGFCDSANNGPRAAALVQELIPHLEKEFRLVAKPEARLITGHSSGGWSSLWLQLHHPEVFGGCWSSAPDPIDFSAFQMTDLYADRSMFQDADGNLTPSYRDIVDFSYQPKVMMTVQQEVGMEWAIDPDGRSGQQWQAWNAMFSPRDPQTGLPVPLFDPVSGEINKRIARAWSRYDISQLTLERWETWGPLIAQRVRLACGEKDSYYLERAVKKFQARIEELKQEQPHEGPGYVLLVPGATHDSLTAQIFIRWNKEMYDHLRAHGLQD